MSLRNCIIVMSTLTLSNSLFAQVAQPNEPYYAEIAELLAPDSKGAEVRATNHQKIISRPNQQVEIIAEPTVDRYPENVNIEEPNVALLGPVSKDARASGTNIAKDIFDDDASKLEQLPEHSDTPAIPSYEGGKDDAITKCLKRASNFLK